MIDKLTINQYATIMEGMNSGVFLDNLLPMFNITFNEMSGIKLIAESFGYAGFLCE